MQLVPIHLELCSQLTRYPAPGASVRREHLPTLGGALGDSHEAVGVSGFDHYEPNGHCVGGFYACLCWAHIRRGSCDPVPTQVQQGTSGLAQPVEVARGEQTPETPWPQGRRTRAAATGGSW